MEIVVEIVNRAHKTIERQRFKGPVTIGRAFDNDFVLSDTHVSPNHAIIKEDDDGRWFVADLNSKNGIFDKHHKKVPDPFYLESGDEFIVGKLHLRVFSIKHPVAPTIGLSTWENFIYAISKPSHFILFFMMALLFFCEMEYLESFKKFDAKEFLVDVFVVPFIALVWAGIWAIVGRILRHETRFLPQSIITLIYLVAVTLTDRLLEIYAFNNPNYMMLLILKNLSQGVLLALLFSFNLRLATLKSPQNRRLSAQFVAWTLVGISLFMSEINKPDFSRYPDYMSGLMSPMYFFADTVTIDAFIGQSASIFDPE